MVAGGIQPSGAGHGCPCVKGEVKPGLGGAVVRRKVQKCYGTVGRTLPGLLDLLGQFRSDSLLLQQKGLADVLTYTAVPTGVWRTGRDGISDLLLHGLPLVICSHTACVCGWRKPFPASQMKRCCYQV